MKHVEGHQTPDYYEFTEDELREKLELPPGFRILVVQGTGPFKVYRETP